jgi:hypothetical protein
MTQHWSGIERMLRSGSEGVDISLRDAQYQPDRPAERAVLFRGIVDEGSRVPLGKARLGLRTLSTGSNSCHAMSRRCQS